MIENLPENTEFVEFAFAGCNILNLENEFIHIKNGLEIKDNVIVSCTINAPVLYLDIPEGVDTIASNAFTFMWNNTREIHIGEGITTIQPYAFSDLDLLVLPMSLKKILQKSSIVCEENGDVQVIENKSKLNLQKISGCHRIIDLDKGQNESHVENNRFVVRNEESGKKLIHVIASEEDNLVQIPDDIIAIDKHAFIDCENMIIVLPSKSRISHECFLEGIFIPEGCIFDLYVPPKGAEI